FVTHAAASDIYPLSLHDALPILGWRAYILNSFCREEAGGAMKTVRLTAAQALVRYLANQMTPDGETFIAGVWAIFGHGNVAGLRSEEHTSELQSRENLVCRLLLE